MKYFIVVLLFSSLFAMPSKLVNAYAVAIYDKHHIEENIQSKRKTKKDYNGVCYTKVYIFGKVLHQMNIKVKIGQTLGHQIKIQPIHKNRLLIGKAITFKHYGVSKGYLEVYVNGKLKDGKTFVQ